MNAAEVKRLAAECGFELAGIAPASPPPAFLHFDDWRKRGLAGTMGYLTDHRGALRQDPRLLLPTARSVICVGKLYHTAAPHTHEMQDPERGWISRYAWGRDYHRPMRRALRRLADRMMEQAGPFEFRVCVDTAPLLERDFARAAGLGWIGKNTCLIHQGQGSWFFLGELLVSVELTPDQPVAERCGSCRRCIDACPTQALVPREGRWELDARRCISYLTIEHRGPIPEEFHGKLGRHLFGCDICQDVCPWNRRAPVTAEADFQPRNFAPRLAEIASMSEEQFVERFRGTPVWRAGREGLVRNALAGCGAKRR
jgi:epoxyqueuosine reductase